MFSLFGPVLDCKVSTDMDLFFRGLWVQSVGSVCGFSWAWKIGDPIEPDLTIFESWDVKERVDDTQAMNGSLLGVAQQQWLKNATKLGWMKNMDE